MTEELVVDASVALKWFIPEVLSDEASRVLESGRTLCAPDLIGPELTNTLWKKVRFRELNADEAFQIVNAFEALRIDIRPSAALLPAALALAVGLSRNVYDCLYLALAVERDCELVTADARFAAALKGMPFGDRVRLLTTF